MAIVPVSADEIALRAYEQRFLIEDRVVLNFIDVVNQGVRDQANHGLLDYVFTVPSFIYGFPKFDVGYVASRLRALYAKKGFRATGSGPCVRIEWSACTKEDATMPSTSTTKPKPKPNPTRRPP